MVVVSIGSLLTLAITTMLNALNRASRRAEQMQAGISEEAVGNKQVWFDLRSSGISFNFLSMGPCGNPPNPPDFYDYLPDTPCTPTAGDDCTRKQVLSVNPPAGDPNQLVLAISKNGLAPATPLSPLQFYDATPAQNFDQDGTLTFRLDKLKTVLANVSGTSLMTEGTILRFYSPITLRPPPAGGAFTALRVPPRMVSLIGVVRDGDIVTTQPDWLQCEAHPTMTTVNLADDSGAFPALDRFFRLMPPVGGKSAFGMVMPIEVVRYRMEQIQVKNRLTGKLLRDRYDGKSGKWVNTHLVATGVASVEFARKNISVPSIKATIAMDKSAF